MIWEPSNIIVQIYSANKRNHHLQTFCQGDLNIEKIASIVN